MEGLGERITKMRKDVLSIDNIKELDKRTRLYMDVCNLRDA